MSTPEALSDQPLGHRTRNSRPLDSLANTPSRTRPLLEVAPLLLLALAALVQLDMLTSGFRRVFYLAVVGFFINHFLPPRYRLRFFGGLCVASVLLVLGGTPDAFWDPQLALTRAMPLLAAGAGLVWICLLPIPFWWRAALLLAVSAAIAVLRSGAYEIEPLLLVWPLLASMFMFRLIIFLYDTHTNRIRPRPSEIVSYFLLYPNIVSTLFPLVDFKTFRQSYYNAQDGEIYRRGADWIIRGLLQLLVYRLIQQLAALNPEDVANGTDLIRYILANTFVYVQVSGYFHLVIGMLLLFGWNLPETNRRYFLASSFTEYWRRVNIYWKDFIVKVVYYPAYFRLKSRGPAFALVVATLWSFFLTWVLHLYQTWWIKGSARLSWPDVLFWTILAVLVLANSLWEMKHGRKRKLASSTYDLQSAASLLLRTAGTFACVALLWSLWSTPTLREWLDLWRFADERTALWGGVALAGIMAAAYYYEVRPRSAGEGTAGARGRLTRSVATAWPLLVAIILSNGTFQATVDSAAVQPWYDALNAGDSLVAELQTRNQGYYERLTSADGANRQLWETLHRKRLPAPYTGEDPSRPVSDLRFREALPGVRIEAYDTLFESNSIGLRDREFELVAPPGTLRIAVLGSSHVMGWGVPQEQVFAKVIERRLASSPPAPDLTVEVMNFAFNGLSPLGQIKMTRDRVAAYRPDIVLLTVHSLDSDWVNRDLARSVRERVPLESAFLEGIVRDARVLPRTHELIAQDRLASSKREVTAWAYAQIASAIRDAGGVPMAVAMPIPDELPLRDGAFADQIAALRAAGFRTVFDLSNAYGSAPAHELRIHDGHSNARAHGLIADALLSAILADPEFKALLQDKLQPAVGSADIRSLQ